MAGNTPTLRNGSIGPYVQLLQTALNIAPSAYTYLALDGIFGPLTDQRVREFQEWTELVIDGIVGPNTWAMLESIAGALDRMQQTARLRQEIVNKALDEYRLYGQGIHAKKAGEADPNSKRPFRAGHERLWHYFQIAAPNTFNEEPVTHLYTSGKLEPCAHWCGIFALYCHIEAKVPDLGRWKIGSGISSVRGFRGTTTPTTGDVGFANNGFEHHVVIERSYLAKDGSMLFDTIEGNSGADSCITHNYKQPESRFATFFTAF